MPDIPESQSIPTDFEGDAFDEWIGGATVSKRSVPIYGRPGLYAEYEDLERQREKIDAESKAGGEMAGSGIARIDARLKEIYEEWMASKSTWIVRALDEDEVKAIEAEIGDAPVAPDPLQPPADLPEKHTDQQGKNHTISVAEYQALKPAHDAAVKAYAELSIAYATKLNLRIIAAAVERIDFSNGRVQHGITVDQILALKKRLGERQLLALIQASQEAMYLEPEIPFPFSLSNSEDDPT